MLEFLKSKPLRAPLGLVVAALLALMLILPIGRADADELPFGQGLLWRVQRDGGPVSYVFGTIHSTDARLRNLPAEVRQAFDGAGDVAFEFIGTPEGQQTLAQAMQLPAGQRLEDILGTALFQRTVAALSDLGVAPEKLQSFKPWALSIFLILPPIELVRQSQGEPAFDFWLQSEAQKFGKRLHSIESVEEQIELFDGLSAPEQTAMVTDLLADYATIEAHFNRMFRAYLKGNIAQIMAVSNDMSAVSDVATAEKLTERLFGNRNRTMAQRMQPLLRKGGAFVAIGAAHLPGDGGVLALLQDQGYVVTRAY
jgi:uncharacterized protein YbaP (TraB family)